MKSIIIAAAVATIAGSAFAQETNLDKYEAGGLDAFSALEKQIGDILIDNGVSMACLGQMTLSDTATLKSIIDGDGSRQQKRSRATQIVERRCGAGAVGN